MALEFKKISGSTPYLLNSASTAEELTLALEDFKRTGAQIIFNHDGEDCILSSFEYKSGIESTVIAYFVTPKKKLLKVDTAAGFDLVITESEFTPETDTTLTQSGKPADAKSTGEAINGVELWMKFMGGQRDILELLVEDGATFDIEFVDVLPETLTHATMYVVKSTGVAWGDLGMGAMTIGTVFGQQLGVPMPDKGWTTDITAETEDGIYCVRKILSYGIPNYKAMIDEAIGNAIGGSY